MPEKGSIADLTNQLTTIVEQAPIPATHRANFVTTIAGILSLQPPANNVDD